MTVEGWEAGSAVSEVFGLQFLVSDGLGEGEPAFQGDGSFVGIFLERLVGFKVVVGLGCVVIKVFGRVCRTGRGQFCVVCDVGSFSDRGHCGWVAGVEVGTFVLASFSIEDCNIGVFVGCAGTAKKLL